MAREYNWNVKNKASKGYEVCMCVCTYTEYVVVWLVVVPILTLSWY